MFHILAGYKLWFGMNLTLTIFSIVETMMDYSKIYFNITYHPIMDNYKEFENISKNNNNIKVLLKGWRENIVHLFDKGKETTVSN